jgi:hypothetical protein
MIHISIFDFLKNIARIMNIKTHAMRKNKIKRIIDKKYVFFLG